MKAKLKYIGAIALAVNTAIFLILKEVFKGRIKPDHLEDLKKGIKDEKKANEKVIKENVAKVKVQDKLIKEKEKEIKKMSMNDQLKLAKKLGLVK